MELSPIAEFHAKCAELINAAPRSHATHCFRSALHHLDRAEALIQADPAMGIFRAITAEEEAASGILRCLMDLQYPGSNFLNPHDHAHKHAVFPFLKILGLFFGQILANQFKQYKLHIKEVDGETRLMLALEVNVNSEQQLLYPIPPLHFGVNSIDSGDPPDYSHQINQFIKAKGMTSIKEFLKKEANLRNRLLYAGPDGYPVIKNAPQNINFLAERRERVFVMIHLYLLLYPYKEHQLYVVQSLSAFVAMINQLKRKHCKDIAFDENIHKHNSNQPVHSDAPKDGA